MKKSGLIISALAIVAACGFANAQDNRDTAAGAGGVVGGAAAGAVGGAIVGGPVGAVVGGAAGAVAGGIAGSLVGPDREFATTYVRQNRRNSIRYEGNVAIGADLPASVTLYEIQEIGTGTPLAAADMGLNTSLIATAGANNTGHSGYMSGWLLDNASKAVTAALQMKVLGLVQRADNAFGQYAKYLCIINNHCFKAGVAGV